MTQIVEVTGDQLPEDATHGFKIVEEDQVVMFFHWHEQPIEEQLVYQIPEGVEIPKGIDPTETRVIQTTTSYADVLVALPDRLAAMGYENEIDAILGEVVGRFGAGA